MNQGENEAKGQDGVSRLDSSPTVSSGGDVAGINGQDATEPEHSPEGTDGNIDDGNDGNSSKAHSISAANSSPSQSVHQDSAKNAATADDTKNSVAAKSVADMEEKAAGAEDSSSAKEDMEVDEIINNATGLSTNSQDTQDSDDSAKEKKTKGQTFTVMERRSSKRQRGTVSSHRYSPGEGGGLASKKTKVINDGDTSTGPVYVKKDSGSGAPLAGNAKVATGEKAPRQDKGGNNEGPGPKSVEFSEPKYRWIDEGTRSNDTPSLVEHQGVEIDFINGKKTIIVCPGDVVMLNNNDASSDEGKQQDDQAKSEAIPIYNDPASREAGLGALDPFIGLVEKLWEEDAEDSSKNRGSSSGQRKKKGKGNNSKSKGSGRMMIRTRWFFKKEDLEGIKGSFVIEGATNGGSSAKDEVMASLSSHDLVLTDQSDDNVISIVSGKVKVVKRKPLDNSDDVEMVDNDKGSYICRYNLSFSAEKSSGKEVTVKLVPCSDETGFKVTTTKESRDVDSSELTSTDDDEKQGGRNNNYASLSSPYPMSPRRVVSEGATTVGKIKIGPNFQAVIPEQIDLQRKTSFRGLSNPPSQRIPTMVWDPATDDGDTVDSFLEEACNVLTNHMKEIELESFLDANYVEAADPTAEAKKPREIKVDCLLTELHECKGDVGKAIKKISTYPERYMTIWNKKEKEQFDTSYRAYRESIRMIANSLDDSKSCKDTVDYQYRFKFVENFRRFMRKKHEKAEEIMATVEDRMLNEKMKEEAKSEEVVETDVSSSEEEDTKVSASMRTDGNTGSKLAVPATRTGPVNNRVRTWFRTGGNSNEDAVGATQQRRNLACDFLTQVMEEVGREAYVTLAKSIKACNSSQATDDVLSDVKTTAKDVMKAHPDLLAQFFTFLPEDIRSN